MGWTGLTGETFKIDKDTINSTTAVLSWMDAKILKGNSTLKNIWLKMKIYV